MKYIALHLKNFKSCLTVIKAELIYFDNDPLYYQNNDTDGGTAFAAEVSNLKVSV